MNCDPIARVYRWLEYAAFGRALQNRREQFLPDVASSKRVLILGDGDGRGLAALLRTAPEAHVDYVDSSAEMLRLARARSDDQRVRYHRANAVDYDYESLRRSMEARGAEADQAEAHQSGTPYDLVVTHFFLDCLTDAQVEGLLSKLDRCTGEGTRWLVSEFRASKTTSALFIRALYLFFRITTRLRTTQLPDYASALRSHGFSLIRSQNGLGTLLVSELWIKGKQEQARSDAGTAQLVNTATHA